MWLSVCGCVYVAVSLRDAARSHITFILALYSSPSPSLTSSFPLSLLSSLPSQLFCPVATQFLTTPMHLLGLDMYNRPASSWKNRYELIASSYRKTVMARIARILPAFGFGGLGNKRIRAEAHAWIKRMHQPKLKGGKEPVVVLGRGMHVDLGEGRQGGIGGGVVPIFSPGLLPRPVLPSLLPVPAWAAGLK